MLENPALYCPMYDPNSICYDLCTTSSTTDPQQIEVVEFVYTATSTCI